jgi:hypothetical protein
MIDFKIIQMSQDSTFCTTNNVPNCRFNGISDEYILRPTDWNLPSVLLNVQTKCANSYIQSILVCAW